MKIPFPPTLRSLPDRALDTWLRGCLEHPAPAAADQEIPAELMALIRSGNWG
ncbi:hypothetical protein [Teichococcus rhizosphaerae]|nr:hypothetical protein [Pseudoroseomonas rhizosphaerae]